MNGRGERSRTQEVAGKLTFLMEKQGALLGKMLKTARTQPTNKVPRYGRELLSLIEEMNTDLGKYKPHQYVPSGERGSAPTTRSLDKYGDSLGRNTSKPRSGVSSLEESSRAIVDLDVSVVPQYRAVNFC